MSRKRTALQGAALALSLAAAPALAGPLRVGAGKADVTPPPSEFPFRPSERVSLNAGPGERSLVGIHDPVFARVIVADEGARRAVIVALEVTSVPMAREFVAAVAREARVPEASVMITATHTHNVPLFSYDGGVPSARETREIERLKQGALAAVRAATASLQPARIAFGRGQAWVNVNNGEISGSKAGYDPLGPSDKALDVIRFATLAGKPIALLVNYANHAEVMFRSVSKGDGYEVTGDLPGAVSHLLETSPDGAPVVLFTPGAEGDQLTLFKSLQPRGKLAPADEGSGGWALLNVQARRVAESVLAVSAGMLPGAAEARIDTAVASAICPGQLLRIDGQGRVTTEARPPVTIPLSLIRINDIVLAGVGGDVASSIGLAFKQASPLPSTMVTMVGASVGYILSDASYVRPGHGLTKSLLAPGCAERAVVGGLTDLIRRSR